MHRQYSCDDCIWSDKCKDSETCEDFVPYEDSDDVETDIYTEKQRIMFRRQWNRYLSDWE